MAEIFFEPTYNNASLYFDPDLLTQREQWVNVLIHEMIHLYQAPLIGAASAHTGKAAEEDLRKGNEQSTAHLEHVLVPLFWSRYGKELEKWM
jgi:hypothetical protein